ncbi:unnamed protein product [Amaranthus hypochondriacus]
MTFQSTTGNKLVMAGRRPYCEHCRIPGHTIGKCYKLQGYPSDFSKEKGKKVAAVAHIEEEEEEEEPTEHVTHISADQFDIILKALQCQDTNSVADS